MAESKYLRDTIKAIETPDPVRLTRLAGVVRWRYHRDFPERRAGQAQARGMNRKLGRGDVEPDSGPTWAEWFAERLGRKVSWAKNLGTRYDRIGVLDLKSISALGPKKGLNQLLEDISRFRGDDPDLDWRLVLEASDETPTVSKLVDWNGLLYIRRDVRRSLEGLAASPLKASLVLTDPPYGVKYRTSDGRRVPGDDKAPLWCVPLLARMLKPDGVLCLWSNAKALYDWTVALSAEGLSMTVLPWDKVNNVRKGREVLIVAYKGEMPSIPFALRHEGVPNAQRVHPTEKPVDLMVPIIEAFSKPGDYVVDPFSGVAPVGVAALRLGRGYFGADMSTKYADVALLRLKEEYRATRDLRAAVRAARAA
jgi:adenine-specific DNA-methyltransferase